MDASRTHKNICTWCMKKIDWCFLKCEGKQLYLQMQSLLSPAWDIDWRDDLFLNSNLTVLVIRWWWERPAMINLVAAQHWTQSQQSLPVMSLTSPPHRARPQAGHSSSQGSILILVSLPQLSLNCCSLGVYELDVLEGRARGQFSGNLKAEDW